MGADVNEWNDRSGLSPLYAAIGGGQREALELLLQLGADVNFVPIDHMPPPLLFVFTGTEQPDMACLQTLLCYPNIDISATWEEEEASFTAESLAAWLGNLSHATCIAAEAQCRARWTGCRSIWLSACCSHSDLQSR
jgi:ankyrin repeat protein